MCEGFREAMAQCEAAGLPVRGGVIVCALRTIPAPHAMEMALITRQFFGSGPKSGGVVGFDVAGLEAKAFPLSLPHISEAIRACMVCWRVPRCGTISLSIVVLLFCCRAGGSR